MTAQTSEWKKIALDVGIQNIISDDFAKKHAMIYQGQKNRPKAMAYFDQAALNTFKARGVEELIEHKKNGSKIVGTFCTFVPDEIIIAAGAIPIRLSAGTELSIADAEIILPREICPMIKSFAGLILAKSSPYFELVDFLVGETTCDGKKKVWELLQQYIPVHVMELPQKKVLTARNLWAREVFLLKEKMEIETGNKITAESLTRATQIVMAKRNALQRLANLRKSSLLPISGKDASLVYQVAFLDDIRRFTSKVEILCDELEKRIKESEGVVDSSAPRIMITGCPMVMPDWKLHHIIETSGAVVVCDDTCSGARCHIDPASASDWSADPSDVATQIKALADWYLNIPCPCFTPGYCEVLQATQMAKDHKVDGVIYYVLQFCHGFNIEYYKFEKHFNDLGIPIFKVQSDYSSEDTGQLQTRIAAFLEIIC
ncbi:MAG: 2-hydroxyacyl-CoA dehydratase family protein [Desulfobacula sp.]|nr:2-hydroxyacyl-CoA dehydratase family protein [Desulfobacula sp.]